MFLGRNVVVNGLLDCFGLWPERLLVAYRHSVTLSVLCLSVFDLQDVQVCECYIKILLFFFHQSNQLELNHTKASKILFFGAFEGFYDSLSVPCSAKALHLHGTSQSLSISIGLWPWFSTRFEAYAYHMPRWSFTGICMHILSSAIIYYA